jgi:hypothetical protein
MAALISSHTPEPRLPIEQYRTEQTFDRHGGYPILDRRLMFPIDHDDATILRITFEEMDSAPENGGCPVMETVQYATSDEAKAEMLVEYDPDQHMLLGFWPGRDRSDVFILTNTDHYLRQLGYTPDSDKLVDAKGREWVRR